MMKARALELVGQGVIRLEAIGAFPPAPAATDATPLEQYEAGEIRQGRNVAGAIVSEGSAFVRERELAADCDALAQLLRSSCLLHGQAFRDCVGIAPGQRLQVGVAEPTTCLGRVLAVDEYRIACRLRPQDFGQNCDEFRGWTKVRLGCENSGTADYPAELRQSANLDFAR
jgi:hypothetical protein